MEQTGKLIDATTARFERLLPGPVERVWDYLTSDAYLKTWLAHGDIPQRAGEKFALSKESGETMMWGEVLRCEPPRLLSYTWLVTMPDGSTSPDSIVTFELAPQGDQALLTLTHSRLQLPEYRARTLGGWHALLDVLTARISGRDPEPFPQIFARVNPGYDRHVADFDRNDG